MGGQESSEFHSKLQWVQAAEVGRLGTVEVFRMLESPYEYVFDFHKNYVEQNQRLQREQAFLKRLSGLSHSAIARIHHIRVVEETQICIKAKQMHIYCNYYNFTLKQAISKRRQAKRRFSEAELVFVFEVLLELAIYLQGEGLVFGNFNSGQVYLSPEGQIKTFLLDLSEQQKHTSYYRLLSNSGRLGELILAPEQLRSLRKMEYQTRSNPQKTEVFSIAMIIFEMLLVESLHIFYSVDKQEILMNKLFFALEMAEQRFSLQFVELLRGCLNADSQKRFDLQSALKHLESIKLHLKDPIHCLRMDRKDLNEQGQLQEEKQGQKRGTFIHNSVAKKLHSIPKSALSSSSTEFTLPKLTLASSRNRCSMNEAIFN